MANKKPDVAGYEAAAAPVRHGKSRVQIHTNLGPTVASSLYYELMVAYHATDGVGKPALINKMYRSVEHGFGEYVDARARTRPKELQHVYEWEGNGIKNARLWRLKRVRNNENGFTLTYNFIHSKKVAPIPPALRVPGPSGKVVKKSAIFKRKAAVLESGQSVIIHRKTAKYLAIPTSNFRGHNNRLGIAFSRGPVKITHPGGPLSTNGFQRSFQGYFASGMAMKHLKSNGFFAAPGKVIKRVGEQVPAVAKSGSFSSKSVVENSARSKVSTAVTSYAN